jgi:proline racemase
MRISEMIMAVDAHAAGEPGRVIIGREWHHGQQSEQPGFGRLATPAEHAAVTEFLASESAGHITGVSLLVCGGAVRAL